MYDSVVDGEYLGWHSRNLRLVNCRISGTQALCYAENLVLEITFEYFDGSDPDVITYCVAEGQDQRYAALLNGGYNGIVRRSDVDTLLEKLPLVYQDQSVE